MQKNLAIITSKENYVWTSMTEIIPWIEHIWAKWGRSRNLSVHIINVDELSVGEAVKALMNSELMVVTCFNLKMAKFLSKIRTMLSLDVKMAFYLHNQATIACWPLINWELIATMNENDVFVGTCRRDFDTMKLNFLNAETKIIPFSLTNLPERRPRHFSSSVRKFSFIGRISAQKNLHTLLWSFHLLKTQRPDLKWELHIFGKDDELGSPLMGLPQIDYETYLKTLADDFALKKEIKFRGFMKREEIEAEMDNDKWIFVSPSLHGDENFGMAAFRNIINGHLAVLSDWGGHTDFIHYFKNQVHGVRVYQGEFGPWIDGNELTQALYHASQNVNGFDEDISNYQDERLFSVMDEIRNREKSQTPLYPTPLALDILKRRKHFVAVQEKLILQNKMLLKDSQKWSQIFEDYRDKTAHIFHKAYGMENLKLIPKGSETIKAPWVRNDSVKDPHRGTWPLPQNEITLLENGWATSVKRFV